MTALPTRIWMYWWTARVQALAPRYSSNALSGHFIGKLPAPDSAVQPDYVEPVARAHRLETDFTRGQPAEAGFELRRSLSPRDLAQVAALIPGLRVIRTLFGQALEGRGVTSQLIESGGGSGARPFAPLGLIGTGGEKNMGSLEQIRGTEALAVCIVVSPTGFLIRRRKAHFPVQQGCDDALLRSDGCVMRRRISQIQGCGLLDQELADHKGNSGLVHGCLTARRGMVLRLPRNLIVGNRFSVDGDHVGIPLRTFARVCLRTT